MCEAAYKLLNDIFSACWTREDAAAESADTREDVRRARDEAIGGLAPLRQALHKRMVESGIEPMELD